MNTFQDLNIWGNGNITYNSQADYVIAFDPTPANVANVTKNVFEDETWLLPKGANLITFDNPVRDLLIIIDVSTANAGNMIDTGGCSSIWLERTSTTDYTIGGIRSIPEYNQAYNQMQFAMTPDFANNFSIDVRVDDNLGNSFDYRITANVTPSPEFSYPQGFIGYEPNISPNLSPFQITDAAIGKNYSVNVSVSGTGTGNLRIGNSNLGMSEIFTGTKANINANLSNLRYIGDSGSGNIAITYSQTQTTDSINQGNVTINVPLYRAPALSAANNDLWYANTLISNNWTAGTGGFADDWSYRPAGTVVRLWGGTHDTFVDSGPQQDYRPGARPVNNTTITKIGKNSIRTLPAGNVCAGDVGAVLFDWQRWCDSYIPDNANVATTMEGWFYATQAHEGDVWLLNFYKMPRVQITNFGNVNAVTCNGGVSQIGNVTQGLGTNAWHHIAVTRNTDLAIKVFFDGQLVLSNWYDTAAGTAPSANWAANITYSGGSISSSEWVSSREIGSTRIYYDCIGGRPDDTCNNAVTKYIWQGYIDSFRISEGLRYTGNFTAPTTDPGWDDTTLILLRGGLSEDL